jgi:hypothetical protein
MFIDIFFSIFNLFIFFTVIIYIFNRYFKRDIESNISLEKKRIEDYKSDIEGISKDIHDFSIMVKDEHLKWKILERNLVSWNDYIINENNKVNNEIKANYNNLVDKRKIIQIIYIFLM